MLTVLPYYMKRISRNERLTMVLSKEMLEGIDRAIELGYAMNRSDFIRAAIADKLKELSIIEEMKKRKPRE